MASDSFGRFICPALYVVFELQFLIVFIAFAVICLIAFKNDPQVFKWIASIEAVGV
jgi:hypothetical protein